ncbi:MAG: penicillin-binding protein [Streptococcaceae bacterium]|jgi:penicillin-binding protein|nr:penicillin-binding protein [Streptococcaceae bacterium]
MNEKGQKTATAMTISIVIRVFRSIGMVFVAFFLLGGALLFGIGAGYFSYLVSDANVPSKASLEKKLEDLEEVSTLTYSNGKKIATIKSDLVRTTVKSSQIAPIMKKAMVATEDEYFYQHNGVVPKAVLRALVGESIGGAASSGGSTLTQQLVKQQILSDEPTFKRKANEIMMAIQVDKDFTKDEILTSYLNVSPFGRNNQAENIAGVEEAARGIFGTTAQKLSLPEAAFIAGLPQSPIVYSPYDGNGNIKSKEDLALGLRRKNNVLFNMYREKMITKKEYDAALKVDLTKKFQAHQVAKASTNTYLYYAVLDSATDILAKQMAKSDGLKTSDLNDKKIHDSYYNAASNRLLKNGYKVKTTISQPIHKAMQTAVKNYGYILDSGNSYGTVQVGTVLLNNHTGAVLGFIGGRNFAKNQNNHALDTERSPGSTIKPVLAYGPAIDKGLIGSESQVSNFPTRYPDGQWILHVGNKGTNRFMSVREALEWSWNIPAYDTYQMLLNNGGAESYMKKMGYKIKDYSIPSLPMGGGADMTVAQQTNGFQTIANGGVYHQQHMIDKITDADGKVVYQFKDKGTKVFSPEAASVLNDLLRSVVKSAITTNFVSQVMNVAPALSSTDWTGKTGTSDDFKDAWLMLSTPKVTMGTWTGYDDNSPMVTTQSGNVGTFLAYVARSIYSADANAFGGEKFTVNEGVIHSKVSSFTGQLPGEVNVNGKTMKTPGETVTSLWAKNGAPNSSFEFGVGGTAEDYTKAWSRPSFKGSDPLVQDGLKPDQTSEKKE